MENIQHSTFNAQRRTGGASEIIGCSMLNVGCWMLKISACLACCLLGIAPVASAQPEIDGKPDSSAFIRIPKDTDDWTRHFRIGALVGMNINARFNENGAFNISGNNPAGGIYDDGYVKPDQTGDPSYTSYWGYNNASQYNAGNNTLTLSASTGFSASGNAKADGGLIPGLEMAYGGNLWYWKHARVGWELGFGYLPVNISGSSSQSATVTQTTFTFNTAGIVVPTAPYQGGPSGLGPLISTAFASSTNTTTGNIAGSQSLDVTLYTLRLGPSFYWDLTDRLGMSLGAGPAVGLMSGDYKYDETVTVGGVSARNTGRISGTSLVYGGYVSAAVMYHVQNDADIYIGAQYMPMGNATISGGGRQGRLDLGGQLYFSVGINWPF
jgi:hypothetical protein